MNTVISKEEAVSDDECVSLIDNAVHLTQQAQMPQVITINQSLAPSPDLDNTCSFLYFATNK